MARMIDRMRQMVRGEAPPPPVAQLIGFTITAVEDGRAVVEFPAQQRHANPLGTLHGGILCDIADAAMGTAFFSTLDEGESFTTLELKINFLKPIWEAKLRAEAHIIKRGRTVGLLECRVTDEADKLVAHATSTCMILRGAEAQGR